MCATASSLINIVYYIDFSPSFNKSEITLYTRFLKQKTSNENNTLINIYSREGISIVQLRNTSESFYNPYSLFLFSSSLLIQFILLLLFFLDVI